MTKEIQLHIAFSPRLAWLGLAFLYLGMPPFAAPGDTMDSRAYLSAPTGMYTDLVSTGPTDLAVESSPASAANGQVFLGPTITTEAGVDRAWTGKVLIGSRGTGIDPDTTPPSATTTGAAMIINGHLQVSGCIFLGGTAKCNWCRAGYNNCDPRPSQ